MCGMYVPHIYSVGVKVCVHMHVYVYVDMWTYMWKPKTDIRRAGYKCIVRGCKRAGESKNLLVSTLSGFFFNLNFFYN